MGRSFSRSPRQLVASVASAVLLAGGLTAIQLAALPAAGADPVPEVYDSFDGTGNADGSATESGGKTWQALNGTWTRSGGTVTTPASPGTNPMLVVGLGGADVDARVAAPTASGAAVFFRVQDASNFLRARIRRTQTSSSYQVTEYQHQDYFTDREYAFTWREWQVNRNRIEYQWQDRNIERKYSKTLYDWSSYYVYSTTGCQANPPGVPGDTANTQYRLGGSSAAGCASGKRKWNLERRDRSVVGTVVQWVPDGSSPPAGYTSTGEARVYNVGSPYWAVTSNTYPSFINWPLQLGQRTVVVSTDWQLTSTVTAPDTLTGVTRAAGPFIPWWTLSMQQAYGYTDPCAYTRAQSSFTTVDCWLTGATRQGAAHGSYWSTTPCAGCPTRTTTYTTTNDQYTLRLGRTVAGTDTNLGSWDVGGTAGLRVVADGPTIQVYSGTGEGTLVGTVTETAFADQNKHGCGIAGSDTVAPTNAVTYCYLQSRTRPPVMVSEPAVTGVVLEGGTLTVSTGTWTGSPTAYSYEWLRCDGDGLGCASIAGATGSTYTVATEDVGARLKARVTAANVAGGAEAVSDAAEVVVSTAHQPSLDEFIIKFGKDSAAAKVVGSRSAALNAAGATVGVTVTEERTLSTGAFVVQTDQALGALDQARLIQAFEARPDVLYAAPNEIVNPTEEPTDPGYVGSVVDGQFVGPQWHYGDDGARLPHVWNVNTGTGIHVAVIDSGIIDHPDLRAAVVDGYDFIDDDEKARDNDGRDFDPTDEGNWHAAGECGENEKKDSNWHGTHVAGTIAAQWNSRDGAGVAPSVEIQPLRVLGKCGGETSDVVDAVTWASGGDVDGLPSNIHRAHVINMSLGHQSIFECNDAFQDAANAAVARGTTIVVSAGNDNTDTENGVYTACSNVIVVGASDENGGRSIWDLQDDSASNHGTEVDISAPGTGVWSTTNEGTTRATSYSFEDYNGTSMATPHVAGVVALVQSAHPAMTPGEIEEAIKDSARPLTDGCSDCGAGIIDATQLFLDLAEVKPHDGLNAMFNGYADGAGYANMCRHWSGGDGTQSIPLGSGKRAWFFSDSFLGDTRLRANGFDTSSLRNAVIVQDGSSLSPSSLRTITGGNVCHEKDPIDPDDPEGSFWARYAKTPYREIGNAAPWYWGADGKVVGGNVVKFWWRNVVSGQLWKETNSAFTVQPVSDFDRTQFDQEPTPIPVYKPGDGLVPILWGQSLLVEGDDVYVYGSAYLTSSKIRRLFLARTTKANLDNFGTWKFRTAGGDWSEDQRDADPVSTSFVAASTAFSVEKINGRYWLFQREPGLNGGDIYAHPAGSRSGFTDRAVKLYSPPEGDHEGDDYLFHYDVRVHDGISSDPDDIVLSYNVNTTAVSIGCRSKSNLDGSIYRPRFITVPAEKLLPSEAEEVVDTSSSGFTTPDPLESGEDNQWFDSWAYDDTHCPDIEHLAKPTTLVATRNPSGNGDVNLSWSNYGRDIHYWLYKRDMGTAANPVADPDWVRQPLWITGTTFTDNPVAYGAYGHTYEYKIRPFASGSFETDLAKKSGAWSNVVSAVARWSLPAAPTGVSVTTPTPKNGTVTVRWDKVTSPNTSNFYRVAYWSTSHFEPFRETGWLSETTTSTTITGLTRGATYNFYVQAYNAEGIGPQSTTWTAVP